MRAGGWSCWGRGRRMGGAESDEGCREDRHCCGNRMVAMGNRMGFCRGRYITRYPWILMPSSGRLPAVVFYTHYQLQHYRATQKYTYNTTTLYYTTHYSLHTSLYTTHRTLQTAHYIKLYTTHCTLHTAHYTPHTAHYTTHYTLYTTPFYSTLFYFLLTPPPLLTNLSYYTLFNHI